MFKDIISRDDGCPWGSPKLSSAIWLYVPVYNVMISELVATQPGIYFRGLTDTFENIKRTDPYPHVILWNGTLYLEDGHHRVVKLLLKGVSTVDVRIFHVK